MIRHSFRIVVITTLALLFATPIAGHIAPPVAHARTAAAPGWISLGGTLTSGPDAAGSYGGSTAVFVRGTDNRIWHRDWVVTFTPWAPFAGVLSSDPGVAVRSPKFDVFARATNNTLVYGTYDSFLHTWTGWRPLGGTLTSAPDASASADRTVEFVVARMTDNAVWFRRWDGSTWRNWASLGGHVTSAPSVISWRSGGKDHVRVFARGTDNRLYAREYDGTRWLPWRSLGGTITSGPDAGWTLGGEGTVLVAARGTDHRIYYRTWDVGGTVHGWATAGGNATADPTVAGGPLPQTVIYIRGTDNALWYRVL